MKKQKRCSSVRGLTLLLPFAVAVLPLLPGCGSRNSGRDRIAAERERWEASLTDSLRSAGEMKDSLSSRIDELQRQMESQLAEFRCVDNPKEVEKYYLPVVKGMSYPLMRTGLTARLTASETLELIAVNTSVGFSRIEVSGGGRRAKSAVVPHDQALNYRSGNMTTVAFSGAAADSVGRVVASSNGDRVTLAFLESGRTVQSVTLSADEVAAVSMAYRLSADRLELKRTETRFQLAARREALLKAKMDELQAAGEKD